ncbi:hypothetical protein G9H62_05925 [Aquirufa ecclesiirivi]|uniref:hypothetical protein n=1 Tax=Aquirufa ecclesiirivi TaxID=2715124 RepID=UPI0022A824CB|nr:hypothetical protein [Aquirufa ecclesiirivi]MCZ2472367.1 hypothetical protein [Aquirufa ecclesiirivi]
MIEPNKIILEVARQIDQKDLQATIVDYKAFNGLLVKFIDTLHSAKMQCHFWQPYLETHLFKFALLNSSLIKEFEGINFTRPDNNQDHKTYNISALYLLARANIETFLLIKYLYINFKTEPQGIFRYTLYEWSGLKVRQNFIATLPDNIAKKADEKKTIEQLENIINQNVHFLSLPDHKRKDIIRTARAKEIGWKEIVTESGLEPNFHHFQWEFYSNYAHSEQIEAMQLKALFNDPTKIHASVYHTLNCTIIYETILLSDLKSKYSEFETIYNTLPLDLRSKIDFWAKFGITFSMQTS